MTKALHLVADNSNMTLARYLEQYGPLTYIECADFLRQCTKLLQPIHEERGFHGTLGSQQTTVSRVQGKLRVVGFDEPVINEHHGDSHMVMPFVAPERLAKGAVEAPADLYALGLLAYTSLSGQHPLQSLLGRSDSLRALITSITSTQMVRLPDDAERPQGLTDIIHKLLEKELPRRYATCQEVLNDLELTWNRSF